MLRKLCALFSNEYKNQILSRLKQIKTHDSDIVTSGHIENLLLQEDGRVVIDLKLDQDYRKMKSLCSDALKEFEWIKNVEIRMAPKKENVFAQAGSQKKGNLKGVSKIIAVSSCKGGVGKSTIALNLTFSLQKMGFRVGIFDADVYGPSLPTLIGKEKQQLYAPEDRPKEILPIEFNGAKTMSYGFASGNQKAIIRGPMVSSIVVQLVQQTVWEELDYLVVDMPPGTGDIQISLCQELNFNGAVIVTTPQRLSFIDVVKGIEMFDVLKVPTISVVENMAEYVCPNCQHTHRPFGPGYMNMLQKQFGIATSISIPLYSDISKYSDIGSPVVLTLPEDHTINQIYRELANNVVTELNRPDLTKAPSVRYETGKRLIIVREPSGKEKAMKAIDVRERCNCALCVDEFTGKRLLKNSSLDQEVYPHKIEPKGNYAVAIVWSDGHRSSIYPYKRLIQLMKQKNNYLLCKPTLNYSFHGSASKNIFNTIGFPDIQPKPELKRTIVGKPEQFMKIAKLRDHQLRFINDDDSFMVPRRLHKQRTQNDSISISSQRTRNLSDHKDKGSESTNNATLNFDVVDQANLIQQMKKIGEQIKINAKQHQIITKKLTVEEKIDQQKNQRVFEKYRQFTCQWEEFNQKLKSQLKSKKETSLIDQQNLYSNKLETLNMLSSIKNQLTDDEEIQRKKLNPLADIFQKERRILKLYSEPSTLKNQVYNLISKEKLFQIPNPMIIRQNILQSEPISRKKCQSEYEKLNISGVSVFDKEFQSIKQTAEQQNQRYKLFKQKQLDQSCHI